MSKLLLKNNSFNYRLLCYLCITAIVCLGFISVAHAIDFDEEDHKQHNCHIYQQHNDVILTDALDFKVDSAVNVEHKTLVSVVPLTAIFRVFARGPPIVSL